MTTPNPDLYAIRKRWNLADPYFATEAVQESLADIPALVAEVERLRRALSIFAHYADINDLQHRDPDDAIEVPVCDLLNASRTLSPTESSR